ncbi:Tfp pilus assembly protein FimT/FimU [Planctomycetota bacterium]
MLKRWAHSRGFTLIELLLTVALLGIVASIVVPRLNYGAIHIAEVKTTAQAFAGSLRLARSLAVSDAGANGQGYKVTLSSGTYSLINAATSTTVKGPTAVPSGINTSGDSDIQFNRLGESADGSAKSVTFSYDTTSAVVTVTPVGGITAN